MNKQKRVQQLTRDLNSIHIPYMYRSQLNITQDYLDLNPKQGIARLYTDMEDLGLLFPACVHLYDFFYKEHGETQTRCFYAESLEDLIQQLKSQLSFHYDILRRDELSDFETMDLGWKLAVQLDRNGVLVNFGFLFKKNMYISASPETTEFDVVWAALQEHTSGAFIQPAIQFDNLQDVGWGAMNGRERIEFNQCVQKLKEEAESTKDDFYREMKAIYNGEDY